MSYCRQCGNELNGQQAFCTACGAPAQPTVQAPYAAPAYVAPPYAPPYAPPSYRAPSGQYTLLNSYLGVVLFILLLVTFLITGITATPAFFSEKNLFNLLVVTGVMLPLALSATLTMRAKGVDLSAASTMILSQIIIAQTLASSGSWVTGLLIALIACAAIGAVNGALTVYLKLPALAVTAVMFFAVWGITRLIASGPIPATDMSLTELTLSEVPIVMLLICLVAVGGSFLLILFTPLGLPTFGREKKKEVSHMLAYVLGGVLASLSGLLLLSRLQMALPVMGYNYALFTAFVACTIAGSRLLDNRYAPVLVAIGAALTWAIIGNTLNLIGVDAPTQFIIYILATAIFAALAIINWTAARKAKLQ